MMYAPYKCCQKSFEDYYVEQTVNGLNYYRGSDFQTGYGLEGLFRSFFRAVVSLLKSGAKAVVEKVWQCGVNMMGDISRGDTVKMVAKLYLNQVVRNLTDKAATQMKTMIGLE